MLQQTTVAAVIPYYQRFLEALPAVEHLAAAGEQQVLRQWEGLGYYRRARQLHAAAKEIVEKYGGSFPFAFADVLALPGVGRYTAGAIASFAFDQPRPIVEANTARLYARLLAHRKPLQSSAAQAKLWEFAEALLPRRAAGEFNQALMELGATVCTPNAPGCDECPVAAYCDARRLGLQDRIPAAAAKPNVEHIRETVVVVRRRGRYLLTQRGPEERWAGMWDFPRVNVRHAANDDPSSSDDRRQNKKHDRSTSLSIAQINTESINAELAERFGIQVEPATRLFELRHTVTRFRITLDCLLAAAASGRVRSPAAWRSLKALDEVPLTTPARRIVRKLSDSK